MNIEDVFQQACAKRAKVYSLPEFDGLPLLPPPYPSLYQAWLRSLSDPELIEFNNSIS